MCDFKCPTIEKSNYQEKELEKYKKIGTMQKLNNANNGLVIFHSDDEVVVVFGNKKFIVSNSDILMLANFKGLFRFGGE